MKQAPTEWPDRQEEQGCDLPSAGAVGWVSGPWFFGAGWRERRRNARVADAPTAEA